MEATQVKEIRVCIQCGQEYEIADQRNEFCDYSCLLKWKEIQRKAYDE